MIDDITVPERRSLSSSVAHLEEGAASLAIDEFENMAADWARRWICGDGATENGEIWRVGRN